MFLWWFFGALVFILAVEGAAADLSVFKQGQFGYACFRIPALLSVGSGRLVAFAEGRKLSCGDHGYVDLVQLSSNDGGATWTNFTVVHSESSGSVHVTIGNPAPVFLASSSTVVLPFCRNNREVFVMRGTVASDDASIVWGEPVNITAHAKKPEWTWLATGPPGSTLLKDGSIVVFADHSGGSEPAASHTILSKDGGTTWALGGTAEGGNENQGVQLVNGSVLVNMRAAARTRPRLQALSSDGGLTFGPSYSVPELSGAVCEGSLASTPSNTLLFTNPASVDGSRTNMTLHVSRDEGASWTAVQVVWKGPTAYSSLVALEERSALLLYERGENSPYEEIVFDVLSLN